MTRVFAFRLNEDDPDEALVMETMENGQRDGWTLREMVVKAILEMNDRSFTPRPVSVNETLTTLTNILDQVTGLAAALQEANTQAGAVLNAARSIGVIPTAPISQDKPVSEALVASLRKASRPSKRLEG